MFDDKYTGQEGAWRCQSQRVCMGMDMESNSELEKGECFWHHWGDLLLHMQVKEH
jgi:hypothetical protein